MAYPMCCYLRHRTKKKQWYNYCVLKKIVLDGECRGCLEKEYKAKVKQKTRKSINSSKKTKTSKNGSKKPSKEYSIMPPSPLYSTTRFIGSERHEVFEGRTGNRQKSIEDGLVIFLTPERHRTGKNAIHSDYVFWDEVKEIAERTWCEYYNKTPEEFRERYGKNYI